MHEEAACLESWHQLILILDLTKWQNTAKNTMKTAIIAALAMGAAAFAPAPSQTRSTALNAQKPVS